MRLKLVKQGSFLGISCDFYLDEKENIYMSRTQIGYALQYKQPQHAVLMLHQRHKERFDKFSIEVKGSQFDTPYFNKDKKASVFMYEERGIYEACRRSNQPIADDFYDWVYDTIGNIRQHGYYIATEKDDKWIGTRQEAKNVRKMETDVIKDFVEYARQQGSKNANRYYTIYTKLVNGKLQLGSGQRDSVSQETLMEIRGLETIMQMHIKTLIKQRLPYKEIYKKIKELIERL